MTEKTRQQRVAAIAVAACAIPVACASIASAATSLAATTTTVNNSQTGTVSGFAFSGGWATTSGNSAKYLGDDHYASLKGSSYTFRFKGTSVSLLGARAPHHGQATVQVDGGTPVVVDSYGSTRQENVQLWASPALADGEHVVKVTVAGTKRSVAKGTVVAIDRAVVTAPAPTTTTATTNDTSSAAFSYSGGWSTTSGSSGKYLGDDHYSSVKGSSYTFRFKGASVALFGARAPHHGQATIQVDGGTPVVVDSYASTRQENVQLWASPVLADGEHVVKVTVAGTKRSVAKGTVVAIDRAVVTAPVPTTTTPTTITPTAPTPTAPSSTVLFHETGGGANLSPYASTALNATHPLWHVESGSVQVNRVDGKLVKTSTGQFHRMFSTKRFGGPGKTLKISYRARATSIYNRPNSSIIEGAKIGLKFPMSGTGYSKDDPRSVYGAPGSSTSPGSYQLLTGLTEGGYMELSRNAYGSGPYKFFSSKRVGYTPGTWKDVTVTVEWVDSTTMRVRYWHNADATGAPVYEAVDTASPFAGEPGFLWLRTDDATWEYDHITVEQN